MSTSTGGVCVPGKGGGAGAAAAGLGDDQVERAAPGAGDGRLGRSARDPAAAARVAAEDPVPVGGAARGGERV